MKRGLIFLIMLVSVLVMGFAQSTLSGTYRYDARFYITFTGNNFSGAYGSVSTMSGTYSVSGNRLTLNVTGGTMGQRTWNWTVVDANTLRDQDGDNWSKEGGDSAQGFLMDGTELMFYNGSATNVTIPAGVTVIGDLAFWENSSLTSITIPSSVTSIGNGAFRECRSLISVTIPSSVTSVGDIAFQYCSSLTSVIIQSGVTSIGRGAFWECTRLTSVTISRRTRIGERAFPSTVRITYSD